MLRLNFKEKYWLVSVGVVFLALCLYPLWASVYGLNNLRDVLLFGVFGLSLHYLFGKTGMLTLGHAVFFGIGAYCTAIIGGGMGGVTRMAVFNLNPAYASLLGLIVGILASGAVALLVGYFLLFAGIRREYFAIMMLAFCLICTQIVISWANVTGGDQGLTSVPSLTFQIFGIGYSFETNLSKYFLALFVAIASLLGLWFACRGNYGKILAAIMDNEFRAKTLGHNTNLHLVIVFTISAMLAGLVGGIYTTSQNFVTWEFISLFLSMDVIIWVFVGGWRNILGPFVGAFLVLRLQQEISSINYTLWPLVLGLLFISSVYLFPEGILTIIAQLFNRVKRSIKLKEEV